MAKFAPVAPPMILHAMKEEGILGDYHLILAHDVAENPDKYDGLFEPTDFVIMDNSVIELGHPVDVKTMEKACEVVKPTLIVLPDKIKDLRMTMEMMSGAISDWRHIGVPFMAVPQGESMGQLLNCINYINGYGSLIAGWGIGRFVADMLGTRKGILSHLQTLERHWGSARFVHLLGFSENTEDDIACAKEFSGFVSGIDSAVPIRLGQEGSKLDLAARTHSPRGDFWTRPFTQLNPLVAENMAIVRKAIV